MGCEAASGGSTEAAGHTLKWQTGKPEKTKGHVADCGHALCTAAQLLPGCCLCVLCSDPCDTLQTVRSPLTLKMLYVWRSASVKIAAT